MTIDNNINIFTVISTTNNSLHAASDVIDPPWPYDYHWTAPITGVYTPITANISDYRWRGSYV